MSGERWQVAGSAAEIYDNFLVPAVFGPWAGILVEAAGVSAGDRVVDVACGTGVAALCAAQAASPGGVVTGIDLNPGMIAVAREKEVLTDVTADWREGDAAALPLADRSADVVLCQQGLQFFPDRPTALSEMQRVLAPGGRLALVVWRDIHHSPGFHALANSLERNIGEQAATIMRAPFDFGDQPETLHSLHRDAGFEKVDIRSEVRMVRFASPTDFVSKYGTGSPLAAHLGGASDAAINALIANVSDALESYTDGGTGIAFPIQGHVVTARA